MGGVFSRGEVVVGRPVMVVIFHHEVLGVSLCGSMLSNLSGGFFFNPGCLPWCLFIFYPPLGRLWALPGQSWFYSQGASFEAFRGAALRCLITTLVCVDAWGGRIKARREALHLRAWVEGRTLECPYIKSPPGARGLDREGLNRGAGSNRRHPPGGGCQGNVFPGERAGGDAVAREAHGTPAPAFGRVGGSPRLLMVPAGEAPAASVGADTTRGAGLHFSLFRKMSPRESRPAAPWARTRSSYFALKTRPPVATR